MLSLYDYSRSSASYRVRIALHYKNLDYDQKVIHLVNDGGEQHKESYQKINPQQLVPSLQHNNQVFTQSLAIIEYLNEDHPVPPLLPNSSEQRAVVRSMAQVIACDVHPLNNLRVLNYLNTTLKVSEEERLRWYHNWLELGLDALEKIISEVSPNDEFCYGDHVTIADLCLIPQLYNARRFNFSLDKYPILCRIEETCLKIPAFIKAHPDNN